MLAVNDSTMGHPRIGRLIWPPWVQATNDRAIRRGPSGNRSGFNPNGNGTPDVAVSTLLLWDHE